MPLFPGESVIFDVRAKELSSTIEETKETLNSVTRVLEQPKPASVKERMVARITHASKQNKLDSHIYSAKTLADNLEIKSEALLSRIEQVSRGP